MTSHCLESCQDADVARPPLFNVDSVVANPQFIGSKRGSAMFPTLFYAGLVVSSRLGHRKFTIIVLNFPLVCSRQLPAVFGKMGLGGDRFTYMCPTWKSYIICSIVLDRHTCL